MADIKDNISQHDAAVFMDMAKDMLNKKNGLYSFVIRVDGGKICDYVQLESFLYQELNIKL